LITGRTGHHITTYQIIQTLDKALALKPRQFNQIKMMIKDLPNSEQKTQYLHQIIKLLWELPSLDNKEDLIRDFGISLIDNS
jgi:hypothetical protein